MNDPDGAYRLGCARGTQLSDADKFGLSYFAGAGGVGRAISSSGCRGTIRPPGSITYTVGTTMLFGSWNDDVFTGSTLHDSFLAGYRIEHDITGRESAHRGASTRRPYCRRRPGSGFAPRSRLPQSLEDAIDVVRHVTSAERWPRPRRRRPVSSISDSRKPSSTNRRDARRRDRTSGARRARSLRDTRNTKSAWLPLPSWFTAQAGCRTPWGARRTARAVSSTRVRTASRRRLCARRSG